MADLSKLMNRHRTTRYVARMLSGNLNEPEIRNIKAWHANDLQNRQEFVETMHLLADMENLADDPDIRAVAGEASPISTTARTRYLRPLLGVAASLLLAVGIGAYWLSGWDFFSGNQTTAQTHVLLYNTRLGEQKTVNLKDGSTLTLNTGTQLLVDITHQHRRIILERGEAFFSVARDPVRPFTVNIDSRTISVLGTEFSIRKMPEKFTLAVLNGMVALHHREEQAEIVAPLLSVPEGEVLRLQSSGQQRITGGTVAEIDLRNNQLVAYKPSDMGRLQSWRNGFLRFDEEPLYKVVQELNRYSAKKILIEDADIMDLKVFSVVRIDRINIALTDLEKTLPIKLIRNFDRIVIVGKNSE